jgi:hypothetical protein
MNMSRKIAWWSLLPALAAALAAGWFAGVRSRPFPAPAPAGEAEELRAEIQRLKTELSRAATAERPAAGAAQEPSRGPRAAPAPPPPAEFPGASELRRQASEAKQAAAMLEDRVRDLEAKLAESSDETRRLRESAEQVASDLAAAKRAVDALQAEMQSRTQRASEADALNQKLRDELRASQERLDRLTKAAASLEEINRRREVYLTNILRRYREITDQYRNMAVEAERCRPPSPWPRKICASCRT